MRSKEELLRLARRVTIGAAIFLCLAFTALYLPRLLFGRWLPDYSVLWTAARIGLVNPGMLYDVEGMTAAQTWLVEQEHGPRPWIYPPSALLVLLPFSVLPFVWSYVWFMIVSVACYGASAIGFLGRRWLPGLLLLSISVSVIFAVRSGQTTFLVGAGMMGALVFLPTRPMLAGALLGTAAAIKPQMLVLAPIALVAGGYFAALWASIAAGLAMILMSAAIFGAGIWFDWLAALPRFIDVVRGMDILDRGITPTAMLWNADVDEAIAIPVRLAFIAAAVFFAWRIFRATDSLPHRLIALAGGALLCSPYAMNYEIVLLAPAAVLFILGVGREYGWAAPIAGALMLSAPGFSAPMLTLVFILAGCATAPGLWRSTTIVATER